MEDDQLEAMQKKAREIMEKRSFERFKANLQVRYRAVGAAETATILREHEFSNTTSEKGRTKETKNLFKVMTEDISKGGIRIGVEKKIEKDTVLLVELQLPDIPLPVSALAKVVWLGEAEKGFFIGLEFTEINKQDLFKIERFLLLQRKSII